MFGFLDLLRVSSLEEKGFLPLSEMIEFLFLQDT